MWCIELIDEKDGIVSIGGCKLGDNPSLFLDNMSMYCCYRKNYDNKCYALIDIDTMRIGNPLRNPDILDVNLSCEYNEQGISNIEYYMEGYREHPDETEEGFDEFFEKLEKSGLFKMEKPYVHPNLGFRLTILENNKCSVEYITSNPDLPSDKHFIQINLNTPKISESNIYDMDIAFQQEKRKYALHNGKKMDQLTKSDNKEVLDKINRDRMNFYEELWGDKIEKAYLEYKIENMLGPGLIDYSDWIKIYQNAGMNENEIQHYQQACEPYMAALQDRSDLYRM